MRRRGVVEGEGACGRENAPEVFALRLILRSACLSPALFPRVPHCACRSPPPAPPSPPFLSADGTCVSSVSLEGTIPITHKARTYDTPVQLYLPRGFPAAAAPVVFLRPPADMEQSERVYGCLQADGSWPLPPDYAPAHHSLAALVASLGRQWSEPNPPPLRARGAAARQQQQQQQQHSAGGYGATGAQQAPWQQAAAAAAHSQQAGAGAGGPSVSASAPHAALLGTLRADLGALWAAQQEAARAADTALLAAKARRAAARAGVAANQQTARALQAAAAADAALAARARAWLAAAQAAVAGGDAAAAAEGEAADAAGGGARRRSRTGSSGSTGEVAAAAAALAAGAGAAPPDAAAPAALQRRRSGGAAGARRPGGAGLVDAPTPLQRQLIRTVADVAAGDEVIAELASALNSPLPPDVVLRALRAEADALFKKKIIARKADIAVWENARAAATRSPAGAAAAAAAAANFYGLS